jgi:hypothetical protein
MSLRAMGRGLHDFGSIFSFVLSQVRDVAIVDLHNK